MTKLAILNKSLKNQEVIKDKIVIWALYDDAQMCYFNTLKDKENVLLYAIGINTHKDIKNYVKVDLSLTNDKLLLELAQLPKPDFIIASPPCESWSLADSITRQIQIKDGKFEMQNISFFEEFNHRAKTNSRKRNYFKATKTRLLGESTINGLILILKTFNPKVWVIENPESSLSWKYQEDLIGWKGFMNKTWYCNYVSPSPAKPTIFKSNIDLNLNRKKQCLSKPTKWEEVKGYELRSSIPKDLILEIWEKVKEELVK